jgi:predicted  nucleic acid-binding Zn-ribbon protein
MALKNKTNSPVLFLIILAIAVMFTGCASANSDSQIRSLENDITTLKKNLSLMENSLNEVQVKNTALETKIQTLEGQVNSLKISNH